MITELVAVITAVGTMAFILKILASGEVLRGDIAGLFYFLLINSLALLPEMVESSGSAYQSGIMVLISIVAVLAFREEDEVVYEI